MEWNDRLPFSKKILRLQMISIKNTYVNENHFRNLRFRLDSLHPDLNPGKIDRMKMSLNLPGVMCLSLGSTYYLCS